MNDEIRDRKFKKPSDKNKLADWLLKIEVDGAYLYTMIYMCNKQHKDKEQLRCAEPGIPRITLQGLVSWLWHDTDDSIVVIVVIVR